MHHEVQQAGNLGLEGPRAFGGGPGGIFGGIVAVNDFSLSVQEGTIHGLIGPNGAGKTTFLTLLLGYLRPDRGEILIDGGFRRGTDVLKALALGARAALVARPVYWGLSVAGSAGVQHVLELLRAELALDLLLCGLGSPAEATRELLVPVGPLARG